jgi:amino acid transporter
MLILVSGFKNYVRFQWLMWYVVIAAFVVMFGVLFLTPASQFVERLNAFALASGGGDNFYQTATAAVEAAGINLNPPFSLLFTLLVAPIAWTSLQWATYSAQQNGEIKDARSFKSQSFIIVGSLVVTGLLLALLAVALDRLAGSQFLYVAGAGYWSLIPEATIGGFYLWPNIIAVAMVGSPLIVLIIGLGYLLNSHQIVHNCYIGMTRIMVAMSLDRLLPESVSKVSERYHTPVNAHVIYFLASIPVIFAYNLVPGWVGLTLGVTFGCGYVFIVTCLAGALLPYRAKQVYDASPGAKYTVSGLVAMLFTVIGVAAFLWTTFTLAPSAFGSVPALVWVVELVALVGVILFLYPMRQHLMSWLRGQKAPWLSALGMLGGGFGGAMVIAFLLAPELGVLGNWDFSNVPYSLWAQIIAFGILILSGVWYLIVKNRQKARGINVDFAFKEIPPE